MKLDARKAEMKFRVTALKSGISRRFDWRKNCLRSVSFCIWQVMTFFRLETKNRGKIFQSF